MSKCKVSPYVIFVNLKAYDKYMLIHGYTGAIDIVDTELANYLRIGGSIEKDSLDETLYSTLLSRGYITCKTFEQEHDFVVKLASVQHRCDKELYKSFMFVITYNCNFRCPYCFENNISDNGKKWTKKVFSEEMVDKAYDAIYHIEPNEKLRYKNITLYGGEPLLRENTGIIRCIINKGIEKGFTFSAITNGYDLEYYKDLLSTDKINFLQITIDGNKEHHDCRRYHYNEGGSFDKIIENIGFAIKNGVNVSVRINTDKENYQDLEYLETLFREIGYSENPLFNLYSAYIYGNDDNDTLYSRKEYIDKHNQDQNKFKCQDWGIYQKIHTALDNRKPVTFRSIYCSSQSSAYVFDPYGEIYTCWETIGTEENVVGNFSNEKMEWNDNINKWHNENVGLKKKCSKCKYVFICSGGCPSNIIVKNGHEYCSDYKYTFESSVNRAYTDFMNK